VIDEIGVQSRALNLVLAHVPRELVDNGTDHFEVAEFFCAHRRIGNVPKR